MYRLCNNIISVLARAITFLIFNALHLSIRLITMNQLIRRAYELCISDIPGVGIIHVAPCLIFHGIVCNTIIPDENVD